MDRGREEAPITGGEDIACGSGRLHVVQPDQLLEHKAGGLTRIPHIHHPLAIHLNQICRPMQ